MSELVATVRCLIADRQLQIASCR